MRYKYPRTYHLPFSPGFTSDDKVLKDDSYFRGKEIVVTEKMDGENVSIYQKKRKNNPTSNYEIIKWGMNFGQLLFCLNLYVHFTQKPNHQPHICFSYATFLCEKYLFSYNKI